jgi:CheY-like chemotaxis protein
MKKIAIVEDNPDNRLLFHAILSSSYNLVAYETGAEAWTGISCSKPDLVLLDISLPDMDGTELLQRIRADGHLRHLPVIAVTAHAMSGDREKYLARGFDEYISKPIVDFDELTGAIQRGLAKPAGG